MEMNDYEGPKYPFEDRHSGGDPGQSSFDKELEAHYDEKFEELDSKGDEAKISPERPVKCLSRDKRRLYKECHVAGLPFQDLDDIWEELCVGTKLALVREKGNPHDGKAVAIALPSEYDGDPDNYDFDSKLGYVPKADNSEIADLLDMGWQDIFECEITSVSRRIGGDITFRIYFRNRWFIENGRDYDALRISCLDEAQFRYFTGSLAEKGFAYFRWGGYPIEEHDLPDEGCRVIFIRKDADRVTLYLTCVIATGDNCLPFVKSLDELHKIDDCEPFVLTNVKGPVSVGTDLWPFLKELGDLGDQPDLRLSKEATERFNHLFESL
ncbi:MAG: HIRAN domain-containing protein [Bacteroidales bacterium]|nr:HIRAN domain-containing protein [Bacteroidales bacterium]